MTPRRAVALGCLTTWCGVLVCALLLGYRPATYADLKTVVALDYVDSVQVSPGLGDRQGHQVVQLRWRQGLLRFRTLVVEERPSGAAGPEVRSADGVTAAVDRPVRSLLEEVDPALRLTTGPAPSTGWAILGWDAPGWAEALLLATVGGTVWLLVTGPPPRRATRWGWTWLVVLLPVAGALAFLLLSGVLSRGPAYATGARPSLTGGRALVVAVVVAAGGFLVGRILL